jgi:hypothetical protein
MSTKDKKAENVSTGAGSTGNSPVVPESEARPPAAGSSSAVEVAEFVARLKATPVAPRGRGRLVFAMDATMSREPTWDMALALQADMFQAVKDVGGLDVQLVYFRGAGECRASRWVSDPGALARLMTTVSCRGGQTQIGKVLSHARGEAEVRKVHALVYVGDAMEENVDELCRRAGELALLGLPVFLFQEGDEERAARAFKEIARLTKGAWCRFDRGSADQLKALLTAVAVYASGGQKALLALSQHSRGSGARLLLAQMKPGP